MVCLGHKHVLQAYVLPSLCIIAQYWSLLFLSHCVHSRETCYSAVSWRRRYVKSLCKD